MVHSPRRVVNWPRRPGKRTGTRQGSSNADSDGRENVTSKRTTYSRFKISIKLIYVLVAVAIAVFVAKALYFM